VGIYFLVATIIALKVAMPWAEMESPVKNVILLAKRRESLHVSILVQGNATLANVLLVKC
jgi:hypothetical protein